MAQKTSASFSRSKYFGFLLKRNLPLFIAYSICLLFFVSVSLISLLRSSRANYVYPSYSTVYYLSAYLKAPITIIIALMSAISNFKFFTSRSECDIYFSIPITRTSLFFSNYSAGLLTLFIPNLLFNNSLVSVFINHSKLSSAVLSQEQYLQTLTSDLMQAVMSFVTLVAAYTLAVFFAVNIGKVFDICFYYLILIFVVPIGFALFMQVINNNLLGITSNTYYYGSAFSWLSPLSFFTLPYILTVSDITTQAWLTWTVCIIIYISVILLILGLSYLLFRIRKTEKVQTPFAFEYFKILLSVVISICLGLIVAMVVSNGKIDISSLAISAPAFIVSSCIAYLGCMAIAKRSFMIFDRKLLYLCIPVAIYFTLFCYSATGGFGKVTYVPSPNEVAKVSITKYQPYEYYYNSEYQSSLQPFSDVKNILFDKTVYRKIAYEIDPTFNENTLTFEDPESIQTIVAFHKSILEHYKKFDYNLSAVTNYATSSYYTGSNVSSSSAGYTYSTGDGYYAVSSSFDQDISTISSELLIESSNDVSSDMTSYDVSSNVSSYGDDYDKYLAYSDVTNIYSPTITYTLKNGKKITRTYGKYLSEWVDEAFKKVQELPSEQQELDDLFEKYLQYYLKSDYTLNYRSPLPFAKESGCNGTVTLNAAEMRNLLQAVYLDESKISSASDFDAGEYLIIELASGGYDLSRIVNNNRIIVENNYTNTIKVLKELGFSDFSEKYKLPDGVKMEMASAFDFQYSDYFGVSKDNVFKSVNNGKVYEQFSLYPNYFDTANPDRVRQVLNDICLTHSYDTSYFIIRFLINDQYYSDVYLYPYDTYK